MNVMTYRLGLIPDDIVPGFSRFTFSADYVSLQDVFHHGIHPALTDNHSRGMEVIQEYLNDKVCIPPNLEKWTHAIHAYRQPYDKETEVYACLKEVMKTCYFVDAEESYETVLKQATKWVETHWDHDMAHNFVRARSGDLRSIRDFLKRFKPDIRLQGFDDVDAYDIQNFVPFDVFRKMDMSIVRYGMRLHNYRLKTAIGRITDAAGRLQLCSGVDNCIVEFRKPLQNFCHIVYHCYVRGDVVTWQPNLTMNGGHETNREEAKAVAKRFGGGTGTFCFRTSLETMSKMLDLDQFSLTFPSLCYKAGEKPGHAEAFLRREDIKIWGVHSNIHASHSNKALQKILQALGERVGGRKQILVDRIIKAAVREYQAQEAVITQFFKTRRFIRIPGSQQQGLFSVLPEHPLGNLLLHVWVLQHMRGNTILDANYENTSVPLEDRIRAVVEHRQEITGGFVKAL